MSEPEHSIMFVPLQLVLNIDGCLGLHHEGDERKAEKEGSVGVFPTRGIYWFRVTRRTRAERASPGMKGRTGTAFGRFVVGSTSTIFLVVSQQWSTGESTRGSVHAWPACHLAVLVLVRARFAAVCVLLLMKVCVLLSSWVQRVFYVWWEGRQA